MPISSYQNLTTQITHQKLIISFVAKQFLCQTQ